MPNVLTPFDGNGENDELRLIGADICPVSIEVINIVNRWGDPVWSTNQAGQYWRGLNNQGEPLPEGSYYYQVRLRVEGNQLPIVKTGQVTLLR